MTRTKKAASKGGAVPSTDNALPVSREWVVSEMKKLVQRVCDEPDPDRKCPAEVEILPDIIELLIRFGVE